MKEFGSRLSALARMASWTKIMAENARKPRAILKMYQGNAAAHGMMGYALKVRGVLLPGTGALKGSCAVLGKCEE